VRGAGAIGATAAFGLAQGIRASRAKTLAGLRKDALKVCAALAQARPTAVDPVNAMNSMLAELESADSPIHFTELALTLAEAFADEDVHHCLELGRHGAQLVKNGHRILTHCNAGALAFVDVGSATAPIYEAHRRGRRFVVFCDETRPRCQGASLTAWELGQHGVEHAVIADNAAGYLMQRGQIDCVIVGSDRVVARTGDAANKIGTYTKAVLAHRHGIPFYVAIPLSTLDWQLENGAQIPIEERDPEEVLSAWGWNRRTGRTQVRIAAPGSRALNPGFDVTPGALITGFITPRGIIAPQALWTNRQRLGCPRAI